MKKIPLIMSLIANILLVIGVFGLRLHYHEMIFEALYNVTASEIRFHERILAELRSEDEYKISAVKAMLKQYIQNEKESAAMWKAAAERSGLK